MSGLSGHVCLFAAAMLTSAPLLLSCLSDVTQGLCLIRLVNLLSCCMAADAMLRHSAAD